MPDNDPFAAFGGKEITVPTEAAPAAVAPPPSSDPFAAFGGRSVSQQPQPVSTPAPSGDPFASFGGRAVSAPSPVNGQGEAAPAEHIYQDKAQPWYKRAFDFAETPLTESVFGLPESRGGAGGFERGAEKIASGFTSPLSVILTAATFGGGSILESAGANLLKQTGLFTAEQLPTIVKASEAALEASKALKPLEPVINSALEREGGDALVGLVNKAKDVLGPVDLSSRLGEENIQGILAKNGFSDDQLGQLAKASKTIQEAKGGFTPVEDAVKSAVGDDGYNLWKQGQDVLHSNGLTEHDLIGGNALERGAFQILRKTIPTMSVASAATMAKTANALLSAGFTYQQFETAAAMSPRFLDALKEGDWESAKEYGTEAAAGAAFGLLGTPHALHAAGELFNPILGTPDEPVKFRPNDQFIAVQRAAKDVDANSAVGNAYAKEIDDTARQALGHSGKPTPEQQGELAAVYHHVVTGGDADKAGAWYNALSEAAGRDDRVRVGAGIPAYHGSPVNFEGPPKTDGLGAHFTLDKSLADEFSEGKGKVVEANLGIRNPLRIEDFGGSHTFADSVIKDFVKQGVLPGSFLKDIDSRIHERSEEIVGPLGDLQGPELAKKRQEAFTQANNEELEKVKSYLKSKGYDGLVYDNKVEGHGDSYVAFDQNQIRRPNNGLPDDIASKIQNSAFAKQPKDYQDLILNSLNRVATGDLSEKELAASKYLRDQDARNYEIGSANDLLHSWIPDHIHRVYEDENPDGRIVTSNAKQGRFSTNVSQARHQVYDSHLVALLKSPKKIVMDPIQSVAQDRVDLVKAAANRQFVDTLRDNFTRGSDGRPAVVLSGAGRVIQGPDGTDPKTFISPDRVRKLNIADGVLEQLRANGDLDRFLDDGTIKDITPRIKPSDVPDTIARLEKQAESKPAQYDGSGNNKLRTDIMYLKSMVANNDFSGLKDFNNAQKKNYVFDPQDYISLEHPSMKAWKFATSDPAGNPIFVNSDIRVHPEFSEFIKNRLGLEKSALQQNPLSKAALEVGTKLKETLLSLSPFHMVQIWLRGLMTGVNPFTLEAPDILHGEKVDPSDPNSPSIMRKMVEQGYTTGTDYRALQQHSEGVSSGGGLLKYIPIIGKPLANSMNAYQDLLFKRIIPSVKSTSGEHMFREYQRLHPDWSPDKWARAAALHANRTFGGINFRELGRSATTMDTMRAITLAPDWLESEISSTAALFDKDRGGLQRSQVLKMAFTMWGLARVLNLATTGKPNYQAPFSVAIKNKEGKEIDYGMRTLPGDILHMVADPVNFVKGRLSPTFHMAQELATQRDNFGRKLSPEDMWVDIAHQALPIPAQAIGEAVSGSGPEIGNTGQVVKALGGTAVSYQTPAQKLAAELAANHNEDGPIDPVQMARHRAVINLEDKLRAGEVTWPELYQLTYGTDQITPSELKKIQANYKVTRELDPSTAALYARASRLPAPEYFQLLDVSNPSERTALIPLTKQVMKKYVAKAVKDLTPIERAQDPTFQRIMKSLPQMETAEPATQ